MSNPAKKNIEVCFSPAVYHRHHQKDANVVVVDILRATTSICTAFMNGAKTVIPVASLDEASDMKTKGFMVAAERDGNVQEFADFGNSPFNFTKERVFNKDIVYSTTNGTQAIKMAEHSNNVLVGAYLNIDALSQFLEKESHNVVIFCAGWKDRFNLEDTLFAGALAEKLLKSERFQTNCDATNAALDLWSIAQKDLLTYIQKTAQRKRLQKKGLDDSIEYCHTMNLTNIIPVLKGNALVSLKCCEKINNFS